MIFVGTSKIDITPKEPLPLVGFGFREGNFQDVHTSLYLKVFVIQSKQTHIFIYGDLIWWGNDTINLFKKQFRLDDKFKEVLLIFHASHTHCAPHISGQFAERLGKISETYRGFVFDCLRKAIEEAYGNRELVNIYRYNGNSKLPINRRFLDESENIIMAPNEQGIVDNDLVILTFNTIKDHSLKGIWVSAACHPTCSGDNRVSMEFQAMAVEQFAQRFGDTVGVYLQGFCGDTRPKVIKDNHFYRGSLDKESEEMAELFYQEIERVYCLPKEQLNIEEIEYIEESVDLPLNYYFEYNNYKDYIDCDGIIGDWAKNIQDRPETVSLTISYWNWGEHLQFLLMNGEIVTEYALFTKHVNPNTICLGYSNGMLAYIPTKQQIQEKGYESYDSLFWFNLPAPFEQDVEKILKKAITRLLTKS